MRTSLYSLYIFFLLSLLGGCQSSRDDIKDKIENMMAKPITIPYSKMLIWTKDSIPPQNPHILCDFKLVVYMDSTHCTECALKGMHLWNDFYKLIIAIPSRTLWWVVSLQTWLHLSEVRWAVCACNVAAMTSASGI